MNTQSLAYDTMQALEGTAARHEPMAARRAEPHLSSVVEGTRSGWLMRCVYLFSDLVSIAVAIGAASLTANLVRGGAWHGWGALEWKANSVLAAGLLFVALLQRTYAALPPRPVRQFQGWVRGAAAICAAEAAVLALFGLSTWALAGTLLSATVLAVLIASFNRAMCRTLLGSARWWGTRLIVVGREPEASQVFANLKREPQWGLRPVAIVDGSALLHDNRDPAFYLSDLEQLDRLARQLDVNRALVIVESCNASQLADLLTRSQSRIRHWVIKPTLNRFPSLWLEPCEAARLPALAFSNRLAMAWSQPMKRAFDVSVSLGIALAVLPLLVAIALLVRCSSPGPILYGQERIGRCGRRFNAWKFRTMVPNAATVLAEHLEAHPALAAEWKANHKLKHDPRITGIGRWLRQISLDELPQIWNVLVGDMSLVGPRPIVSAEIDKYGDCYQHFIQVLPGITGLWQVSGRNNTTYDERVSLDAYYVQNWSLWLDIYILANTAKVVLLGEGAY
jgi:Undecaprenyl-phosphate galactose phosphotransferase WbaP